ncbi:hypothetical protein FRC08_018262 [Ceratobasidium sp. 394]|nr:hypothetical protein FRC08_018262 [Ceratobasidium sp. 394]
MSELTHSFVPPPQEGSSSAGQPLALQTVGATTSAAPLSLPQAQIAPLNASPNTQLPDSPMSSVSHPATPSVTSSHATDPAAGSPGTHSSEHWDCQSPPHQQPRPPNTQSQDASAFLSTPSRCGIRPRMRPIPTDSDEELAPKAPPAAPATAPPAAPPAQHLFVDLTRSSQLSSSTAAPSQRASGTAAPAQPAPGTPATGQPESQEGSVIDMTDSSKPTPRLQPVNSVANRNVHITTTTSGQMLAADKLAHSKSGQPILNAQEYRLSSGGDLLPFFKLSSGAAGTPMPANTPSPTGAAKAFTLPPMELILDFSKGAAQAGKASVPSGSKASNAPGRNSTPPATPPAKRPRTLKNIEVAEAALSEQEKEDLDVPLESDEDEEMDNGMVDEGDNGNTTGTRKTQRYPEEAKSQILTFFFDPETFLKNMEDWMGAINELVILLMGVMTKRQIGDYIRGVLTRYHAFNQLAMVTGGSKDDMLTREEMESRYHRTGAGHEHKFEFWWNYRDSPEFQAVHKVSAWDLDDMRKFMHLDSVAEIMSDHESDHESMADQAMRPSKSKDKGKGRSRKWTRTQSGSETEREHKDNDIVTVKVLGGVDGLVTTQQHQLDILQRQLKLDMQKAADDQVNQLAQIALNTRSAQVNDFLHISQVLATGVGNLRVLAHAEALLTRLSLDLNVPAPPAAAAPPPAVPVQQPTTLTSGSSARASPSGQPVTSGSGSSGSSAQAGTSAPGTI